MTNYTDKALRDEARKALKAYAKREGSKLRFVGYEVNLSPLPSGGVNAALWAHGLREDGSDMFVTIAI